MPTLPMPACDHAPQPYEGPSLDAVLAKRRKHLNHAIFHFYKEPIMIVEGSMQWLWDETGRRYLDAIGGICTVGLGHCHPEVTAAMEEQARTLQHATTIYLHPTVGDFAEELAATMPEGLDRVYFVNSGSEANDLAILMARMHTGNTDVIALRNGYHGGSHVPMTLTSHSTWKYNVPLNAGVHHAKAPHPIFGAIGYDEPCVAARYAAEIREKIQFATSGRIAAFIAESIQGVGGAIEFPDGYLEKCYEHARAAGGLCIADEVQTGFGRTGSAFWGFQNHGVTPDIVVMAKSIGNGYPLAAVVTTDEISEKMGDRIHFNTYGGDAPAMAQGLANLRIIQRDDIQGNCRRVGDVILGGLRDLQKKHPQLVSVRGRGLMIGFSFVEDPDAKLRKPGTAIAAALMEACRERGVLVGKGGYWGSAIRLKPPMCITEDDARFILAVIEDALGEILG